MLALAVCGMLCGSRSLYAIAQWGQECGEEIRLALGLRKDRGPSVATLHRAFKRVEHAEFEGILKQWFGEYGLHEGRGLPWMARRCVGSMVKRSPESIWWRPMPIRLGWCWPKRRPRQGQRIGGSQTAAAGSARASAGRPCGDRRCVIGNPRPQWASARAKRGYFWVLKENCPATLEAVMTSFADPQRRARAMWRLSAMAIGKNGARWR